MNILITGANGYLGKETVRFILENTRHNVIGVSRHWDDDSSNPRFQKITCDLLSPLVISNIKTVDVVVHLAALVKINLDYSDEAQQLLNQNTKMLFNVLNWAQDHQVKKFVFVSSMTVYQKAPHQGRLTQRTPLNPSHFYGLSKQWGEELLHLFCSNQKIKSGLILRFPGLFGGRRKGGMLYNTCRRFKANEDIELNLKDLGNWDVLHVTDAVQMLARLIDQWPQQSHFNVLNAGYGDRMNLDALLKQMKRHYLSRSTVTILNEQDYYPCSMTVDVLKKLLGSWGFSRKKSIKRFLQEID